MESFHIVFCRAVARDLVLSGSGGAGDAERDEGKTQLGAIEQLTVDEDDAYFSSYARISIHTEMLEVDIVLQVMPVSVSSKSSSVGLSFYMREIDS